MRAELGDLSQMMTIRIQIGEGNRCWATMRLATLEDWIGTWALQEMYAGISEMGAVDAWHEALTRIEELKLDGKPFCGGVADIAKCFDQA